MTGGERAGLGLELGGNDDDPTPWRKAMHGGGLLPPPWSPAMDDAQMFDLAPVSLWLEDYGRLRRLYQRWRAEGVTDLRQYLSEDPARIAQCFRTLRVVKVNRQTLKLFECPDLATLNANLESLLVIHAGCPHTEQLVQMWDGHWPFSFKAVDRSLHGRAIDVQVHGMILPGHEHDWRRVMVAVEDVTAQERARRELLISERYAHSLFENSPVALFAQDCRDVKRLLDDLRAAGVTDLRAQMDRDPGLALKCLRLIRVVDANQAAIAMYGAPDKATLLDRMDEVMREDMLPNFIEEVISFWGGGRLVRRETVNYTFAGAQLNVLVQVSLLPGHEDDWGTMLVAIVDITARKQAETHLEFLSRHDTLTGLQNRAAYGEHLRRLDRDGPYPISVIIVDLDGLKDANDRLGHAVGDELLRRGARILSQATTRACCVARIGGDEFAMVLPATEAAETYKLVDDIQALVARDNESAPPPRLRLSIGAATCHRPGCLEATIRAADMRMYEAKREARLALATLRGGR